MARLAGKFAGIVVVSVPDERTAELTAELDTLTAQGLLDVTVAIAANGGPADDARFPPAAPGRTGPAGHHPRDGRCTRTANVSIEELETSASSAPMSGELLFEATATLRVPAAADPAQLRASLEAIANELMVDLDVTEQRTARG